MAVFKYTALSEAGRKLGGVLDADTAQEARRKLRLRRLHVTRLARLDAAKPDGLRLKFFRRRKPDQVAVATREMATLLTAGIELVDALGVLLEQIQDNALAAALRDVRDQVAQGNSLAKALKRHPRYFNEFYVRMVGVGEASGTLGQIMASLSGFLHKQIRGRNKLVSALTYPMVTMCFGGIVVVYLLTFFVPKMEKLLTQHGKSLPLPTEILLGASRFFSAWWWALALAVLAGVLLVTRWLKVPSVRYRWHGLLIRLPVLGAVLKKYAIMRFAMTFSVLLKSGLQVLEALNIAKGLAGNMVLVRTLDEVSVSIRDGADISQPLKKSRIFPPVVSHLIAVGEKTGQLEDMLDKIAADYEEEVDGASQRVLALVEPALIIVMAAIVGFIMLSIFLPIMQMSSLYKG